MTCPGEVFLVGGPVRDQLLGLKAHDRDWVVVGSTPEQMLQAGFTQVGKDFPVFLHPETKEEYALARTERKQGKGYQGFTCHTSPDVSLEEDLQRRDFTINAMALGPDQTLIDPYHGQSDLQQKLLRHVSPAFAEDPLRVLRGARFLARLFYLGFRVADETQQLMSDLVDAGELEHLSAERVWKETERALTEQNPEQFFQLLMRTGALSVWWQELTPVISTGDETEDTAQREHLLRFPSDPTGSNQALLCWGWLLQTLPEKQIRSLNHRLKSPKRFLDFALLYQQTKNSLEKPDTPENSLKVLEKSGALKQGGLFEELLQMLPIAASELKQHWQKLAIEVRQISAQHFSEQGLKGPELGQAIRQARLVAVEKWLAERG